MKFPTDARRNKVIKTFQALGFQLLREGNHIIIERQNSDGTSTPLVMPNHPTINSGTLRAIVSQCGISREEFLQTYIESKNQIIYCDLMKPSYKFAEGSFALRVCSEKSGNISKKAILFPYIFQLQPKMFCIHSSPYSVIN